ncbi:uncharacterized protein DNG_10400 [Cephalotrichum gorgonifer]|uniref:Transcription factor domain-containing protein n=1 Tax=Cephalotrichum gorgonifer TaxID=2041049 RepID=A0AAE8N9G9_9PEZI|nr:uncharacterized protein DNG_10400 [Cephalotrichum gorgonifer]
MQLGQHPRGADSSASSPQSPGSPNQVLPVSQARALIKYHEESLAWMHNVVHCPTFRDESELFFETGHVVSPFWLPLYYTILSTTLFLALPSVLSEYGIFNPEKLGEELYRKSIEALFAANFMASHSLISVQTTCLLIHVGHNLGESDFIATLMGSAIRIAQSLGLHRLGPDAPIVGVTDTNEISRRLIEREVQKRVWWFLIRQDWLQIPFLNTYTIHATQFNTPMPNLCHDNPKDMIRDGSIVEQDVDTFTQSSYTSVHNHISVLIWKTQDRLCSLGHPSKMVDGLRKLYEEVIIADSELKKIMKRMPVFYREDNANLDVLPPHITQQRRVMLLSMCHKFLTIHRHFQVPSFKDPWFSFTKISCLSIARRCLQELFSLPNDEYTWIVRSMWTTSTHMVAAAVSLMFEELFTEEGESMIIDRGEIESLVRQCAHSLGEMCGRSEIARKGVSIIDSLLDLTQDLRHNNAGQFDLEKIIRHVREDAPAQTHLQMDLAEIDLLECLNWPCQGASGR